MSHPKETKQNTSWAQFSILIVKLGGN